MLAQKRQSSPCKVRRKQREELQGFSRVIGGPRRRQLPIKELWTNVSLRKARFSRKRRIAGIKEALLSREDESRNTE
jgi:hypothetical protein